MSSSSTTSYGMPRRLATAFVATALTAGPAVLLGAAPAHAAGEHGPAGGTADAVVLRAGLNVGLLNKTLDVPLNVALNDVHAPATEARTTLTAKLDGVDQGKPVNVLRADVATARAAADRGRNEGYANLVKAKVHLPGLPLLSLIEVQQVTAKAVCEAGGRTRAESNVLGPVQVLGKKVTLTAGGTTDVKVPDVGEVRLDLSKKSHTSKNAAATALELNVSVNPAKLNVADVRGKVVLAEAKCTSPHGNPPDDNGSGGASGGASGGSSGGGTTGGSTGGTGSTGGSGDGGASGGGDKPAGGGTRVNQSGSRTDTENLAETGGSSATPYLAGGAAVLLAAGAGATVYARRRRGAQQGGRG